MQIRGNRKMGSKIFETKKGTSCYLAGIETKVF